MLSYNIAKFFAAAKEVPRIPVPVFAPVVLNAVTVTKLAVVRKVVFTVPPAPSLSMMRA